MNWFYLELLQTLINQGVWGCRFKRFKVSVTYFIVVIHIVVYEKNIKIIIYSNKQNSP